MAVRKNNAEAEDEYEHGITDLKGLSLKDLTRYHSLMRESEFLRLSAKAIVIAYMKYPLREDK